MALSDAEKMRIIRHLGWPARTIIANSTSYSKPVVDQLANLTAEIETLVRELLTSIETVEASRLAAIERLAAKRVGDIETNPNEPHELMKEKRRLLDELASFIDIENLSRAGGSSINVVV